MNQTQIEIVTSLLDVGKYKGAIEFLNKIINSDDCNTKSYELRGATNYLLLNPEEALSDFTKAIELDSRNDIAYSSRGVIWRDKQEFSEALKDFEAALSICPENLLHKLEIAHVNLCLKNYEEVILISSEVLNADPVNYHALLYKADAFLALKKYPKSVELYKTFIYNFQADGYVYNNLAFGQIYTGELKEAKKNFKISIELNPDFSYSWDNLGYVYYLEKDYIEALKLINKSIELNISNSWAYKNRSLVYLATDDKEKAHADLLYAIELGYSKEYDDEVENLLSKNFH